MFKINDKIDDDIDNDDDNYNDNDKNDDDSANNNQIRIGSCQMNNDIDNNNNNQNKNDLLHIHIYHNNNRPFALWRHFTTMTRILQGFAFLCKLAVLLLKLLWDYQIKIWKEKRKGFWS